MEIFGVHPFLMRKNLGQTIVVNQVAPCIPRISNRVLVSFMMKCFTAFGFRHIFPYPVLDTIYRNHEVRNQKIPRTLNFSCYPGFEYLRGRVWQENVTLGYLLAEVLVTLKIKTSSSYWLVISR
mmetsp:Transcript_10063/g.17687  ORF Transcript_10063/g.17687 Transcript_10063/m.17687 type:complete len:124 (-) Transcript_10063:839-1210(-)